MEKDENQIHNESDALIGVESDSTTVPLLRHSKAKEELLPILVPICVEESEAEDSGEGSTFLQAVFNVVNVFVGVGLLSLPYAMALGGWVALLVLLAMGAIFFSSARMVVASLRYIPSWQPQTYPQLGRTALGQTGYCLVTTMASMELFGGSCIMLLVMFREVAGWLPEHGLLGLGALQASIVACLAAQVPLLFIPSMARLSWLSMLGLGTGVGVAAAVLGAVLLDPHRTRMPIQPPAGHDWCGAGLLQAVGIMALSVAGHSSLPAIRGSMRYPHRFGAVLGLSFAIIVGTSVVVAGMGYLYFGRAAAMLVTADLAANSVYSGHWLLLPGLSPARAVSVAICLNAFTTYPLLLLVLQETLKGALPHPYNTPRMAHSLRFVFYGLGACLSVAAYDVAGDVFSIVGGLCAMCSSLLLPALFYFALHRGGLARWRAGAVLGLLGMGGVLAVLIVGLNVQDIWRRAQPQQQPEHASSMQGQNALQLRMNHRTVFLPYR